MEKVSCLNLSNCLKLSNGQVEVVVTTDIGPRIIRYAFVGGENILGEMGGKPGAKRMAGVGRPPRVDCAGGAAEKLWPRQRPDQTRGRRDAWHSTDAAGRTRYRDREGADRHARRHRQRRHRAASPDQSQQDRLRARALGAHHHERRRHRHRPAGARTRRTRMRCSRRARWCSGTTRTSPTRASRSDRSTSACRPTPR